MSVKCLRCNVRLVMCEENKRNPRLISLEGYYCILCVISNQVLILSNYAKSMKKLFNCLLALKLPLARQRSWGYGV